jgi:sulfane dehydrogenase subunit SoxC
LKKKSHSRPVATLIQSPEISPDELQLAVRNHSMPLEALRYDITPLGLHYLLIHFDIPMLDPASYALNVGGHVRTPLRLPLDEVMARPATTAAVTLECAGNGRARLSPRPVSQPWLGEAVGNAEWTGTPLRQILEQAGVRDGAVEVVFTGHDRGVQGGVAQLYERSLTVADALHDEVLLAYAINGRPLPPQHGFPLRLIVPGWYGMAHVKWLRSITVTDRPFAGYQQAIKYQVRTTDGDVGAPVRRIRPRALMIPPGAPEFMSRTRFVEPSIQVIEGRAWSGQAPVVAVDFSHDGGRSWAAASLQEATSPYGWRRWTCRWDATRPGEYELCVRASDAAGNVQPLEQNWNVEGVENNAVQRVHVVVGHSEHTQLPADSL